MSLHPELDKVKTLEAFNVYVKGIIPDGETFVVSQGPFATELDALTNPEEDSAEFFADVLRKANQLFQAYYNDNRILMGQSFRTDPTTYKPILTALDLNIKAITQAITDHTNKTIMEAGSVSEFIATHWKSAHLLALQLKHLNNPKPPGASTTIGMLTSLGTPISDEENDNSVVVSETTPFGATDSSSIPNYSNLSGSSKQADTDLEETELSSSSSKLCGCLPKPSNCVLL